MNQPSDEPILQVKHLTTIFPDGNHGLHALDDISFSVCAEQFVCVLGPSGSGKTTLLRILAGLLPPTHGEVLFGNSSLKAPRHGVGMVFQKANLMPWRTVLENILLPLEIQRLPRTIAMSKAQALVDLVGLRGFEDSLPRDLSGGMANVSPSPEH
jgi:NitT/TauT family transport system ATP-binding protein